MLSVYWEYVVGLLQHKGNTLSAQLPPVTAVCSGNHHLVCPCPTLARILPAGDWVGLIRPISPLFSAAFDVIKPINYVHIKIFRKKEYWFKIRMEFLRPILAKIELNCQQPAMSQWGGVQVGKPASSGVLERMAERSRCVLGMSLRLALLVWCRLRFQALCRWSVLSRCHVGYLSIQVGQLCTKPYPKLPRHQPDSLYSVCCNSVGGWQLSDSRNFLCLLLASCQFGHSLGNDAWPLFVYFSNSLRPLKKKTLISQKC